MGAGRKEDKLERGFERVGFREGKEDTENGMRDTGAGRGNLHKINIAGVTLDCRNR